MCAALLHPLWPTYLGTWGYRERVRRLTAARELGSGRHHVNGEKSNFKFGIYLYLCRKLQFCYELLKKYYLIESYKFTENQKSVLYIFFVNLYLFNWTFAKIVFHLSHQ